MQDVKDKESKRRMSTGKIMVVEDDLALSAGLCFEMDMNGYLTVAAYNIKKVVEQISQRGKIVVHAAVCTVHIVVDSDKTHALLGEQHFRVKSYLQVVSP